MTKKHSEDIVRLGKDLGKKAEKEAAKMSISVTAFAKIAITEWIRKEGNNAKR